ncbi:uracil-DNA glycosylase [Spiroplasma cantharicola]|uniref:Uracil-DNA glycosylase n=1 Tax=Spiroplasma cantharicola TaxID=362837 RepID=A0A0M3SJ12_9MOLU|nr:uracil-DNA glycosylase [Spiroplasma cantharicola]ALD65938.1 uracil-DNA glycosylase [Spiroplasma cantharicola]
MNILKELSEEWIELFSTDDIIKDINSIINKIEDFENIYPKKEDIFKVFNLIKPQDIKVIIIGQDPYHGKNQANGIAFSVSNNVRTPPSLRNIFKELRSDLGIDHSQNNDLSNWVKQGVFLINSCLTVEKGIPNSHKNLGWDKIILKILNQINKVNKDIIFCLWGNFAKKLYNSLVFKNENEIIFSAHPSPFSFKNGFENSKPFSKINLMLKNNNKKEIFWEY